jgi:hypothetical protein
MEDDVFGPQAYEIFNEIEYHAEKRFHEYHPTFGPRPEFFVRLRDWLDSAVDEEDQKKLLQLVCHIFFAGIADFNALYRAAYQGPVKRWLVDQENLDITSDTLSTSIDAGAKQTWFCPITDSMQISTFYHVNKISGRNERPDWHSLSILGDRDKIARYVDKQSIKRIVLLEDFVGSGSQVLRAVNYAATIPNISILLLPMIVCPAGLRIGENLAAYYGHVDFVGLLPLPPQTFIADAPYTGESPFYGEIRELACRIYTTVSGGAPPDANVKPYGPYGFAKTGGLTVPYANCPDNTLPLIHHTSDKWKALFPRSTRI